MTDFADDHPQDWDDERVTLANLETQMRRVCAEDARRNRERHILERLQQGIRENRIHFAIASDLSAEVFDLHGEMDGSQRLSEAVEELHRRHEGLHRGEFFAAAIRRFHKSGDREALRAAQHIAEEEGGFLKHYTPACIEARLRDPHWVIAHAKGSRLNSQTMEQEEARYAADVHIQIPLIDDTSGSAFTRVLLPDEQRGDLIMSGDLIQRRLNEIHSNPALAGVVEDLSSEKGYMHLRFASAAREAAVQRILDLRREGRTRVRYLLAGTFSVTGLREADGTRYSLQEDETIDNTISVLVHRKSKRLPFLFGWRVKGCDTPVTDDPNGPALQTDWNVLVADLQQAETGAAQHDL
ncbi:MAG: hypothetical protein PHH13_03345 [Candidatus Peribacteraceae bacterium]|nr:hypothetical protein [Candidatus Peribacteraceae bacterium]